MSEGGGGSPYAEAIVGGLMPMVDIGMLSGSANKRKSDSAYHRQYASDQRTIRTATLNGLQGRTAETLMKSHNEAEVWHHGVADGHDVKGQAWADSEDEAACLKSGLEHIVFTAEKKIKDVQRSKMPEAAKIAKIASIVAEARADALHKVSQAVSNVLDSVSKVLAETGQQKSVTDVIQGLDNKYKIDMPSSKPGEFADGQRVVKAAGNHTDAGQNAGIGPGGGLSSKAEQSGSSSAGNTGGGSVPHAPAVPVSSGGGVGGGGGGALPGGGALTPGGGLGSAVGAVSAPAGGGGQGFAPAAQSLSPNNLASGFSSGMASGVPAAQASAITTNAATPAPAAGYAAPAPVSQAPQSAASSAPVVSAPAAPAPMVVQSAPAASVAASPSPQGPLPAYGSDLRAAPLPSSLAGGAVPSPGPGLPGTATFPSGGSAAPAMSVSSGLGQPAVVRTPPPAAMVGQVGAGAVAATGATSSAVAETVEEQRRCDEWLNAVAVQEPRIRWAAGTRSDGSIVLVTDLAGGWIPPHVRLPAGAQIVQPGAVQWDSRGSVTAMLGSNADCVYSPGQPTRAATGVEFSDWARQVDPVDDVGRVLCKAADWRDGLPRLAHIMAKAWARRTGVRDTEVADLRAMMTEVRAEVLGSYPDQVDGHQVGNWMLLAAIDAFCAEQFMLGNYHFRWFTALLDQAAVSA